MLQKKNLLGAVKQTRCFQKIDRALLQIQEQHPNQKQPNHL